MQANETRGRTENTRRSNGVALLPAVDATDEAAAAAGGIIPYVKVLPYVYQLCPVFQTR